MVRIIVTAVLVVLLAVLVAFNLRFTTSVSIYGALFEEVPVMVIALLSFALGVTYSLVLYTERYLSRRRKLGRQKRHREVAKPEQEPSTRDSATVSSSPAETEAEPAAGKPAASPPARGRVRGLFRRERFHE
jgi:uncharacterized integral membrane protein